MVARQARRSPTRMPASREKEMARGESERLRERMVEKRETQRTRREETEKLRILYDEKKNQRSMRAEQPPLSPRHDVMNNRAPLPSCPLERSRLAFCVSCAAQARDWPLPLPCREALLPFLFLRCPFHAVTSTGPSLLPFSHARHNTRPRACRRSHSRALRFAPLRPLAARRPAVSHQSLSMRRVIL